VASDGVPGREMDPGVEVRERAGPDNLAVTADASRDTGTWDGTAGEGAAAGTVDTYAEGTPDGEQPAIQPTVQARRLRRPLGGLRKLIAGNMLFCIALGLGATIRVIVMAGFRPAALIRLDSYFYLLDTGHATPDPDNPNGYPFFLWLLKPFHSLGLVAGVQHLMGLGIAVLMYALLRRHGVHRWVATLAATPVLLDPRELLVEHSVMSDTLATLLVVAAFAVLLSRPSPSAWRSATAGLLLGASSLVRPTALPLILLAAGYLVVKRAGWRRAGAALAAGLLPVAGYATWFFTSYGVFNLTNSAGLFLWSRTMSFANCAVIEPPPDLRPLCPDQNPGKPGKLPPAPYSVHTLLKQQTPQDFLWSRRDWPWQPRPQGYEPYQTAFTPAKNARAQRFAIRAIIAQPLGYATVVGEGVALTFLATDHSWRFPHRQPVSVDSPSGIHAYAVHALQTYLGNDGGLAPYLGRRMGTRLVEPYERLIRVYQSKVYLPGVVFAAVLTAGLATILIRRKGSGPAALLWVSAVVAVVLPVAEHQFNYRYALAALPLACMAAALGMARHGDLPPG
jgi:hypothetical protein